MKPDADQLLRVLAGMLMGELAPRLPDDYLQRSVMMTGMLLAAVAEEWDRGVARRAEENEALRALFAGAVPGVGDPALRRRLEAAAGSASSTLVLSELEQENTSLRGLLIELHAHVETLGTEAGRRIEGEIWRELRRSTERRALSIAPF